jgi:hypothetical protein
MMTVRHIDFFSTQPTDPNRWSFIKETKEPKWVTRINYISEGLSQYINIFVAKLYKIWHVKDGSCEHFRSKKVVSVWKKIMGSNEKDRFKASVLHWRGGAHHEAVANKAFDLYRNHEIYPVLQRKIHKKFPSLKKIESLPQLVKKYYEFRTPFISETQKLMLKPFDPALFGNIPFVWDKIPLKTKNCLLMRMPTATKDIHQAGGKRVMEISEEFKAYTKVLKDKNQKHLYINLMSINKGCNEGWRSQALKDWADQNKDCLTFLSLDKNSDFYKQEKEWREKTTTVDQFFKELWNNFHDPIKYVWPSDKSQEELDEIFKEVFQIVKNQYSMPATLDRHERAILIDLVHTELIKRFLMLYEPDSCNISCLNCIDRGVAQQLQVLTSLKPHPHIDQSCAEKLFIPAWNVSGRLMQEERFVRMVSVLDRMGVK